MYTTESRYLEYIIRGYLDDLITLEEFEGISDEQFEKIYAHGYNYFIFGKYKAAKDIFTGLTTYSPDTAYYWRALGAVNQQMKNYTEAIAAYDMAIANEENDIVSYVYRGETKLLMRNVDDALEDLEEVVKLGKKPDNVQFQPWVERAQFIIDIHR